MAVSKLWPVTVRLATVLDYASNPEKTSKAKSKYNNADYQALRDVVNYVKNGEKTEQELFCEGINCTPAIAREQFVTVKEQFDKTDGIQATTVISALRRLTSHRSLPNISEWSSQIPFGARNIRCW